MSGKVALVTGVGPGNGASFCRALAGAGYRVAMLARDAQRLQALESAIAGTRGYPTDVAERANLQATLAAVASELGPIEVVIHNAGSAQFSNFLDTKPEALDEQFRINTLALLVIGQAVVPAMLERDGGTFIVIGATASLRGGAPFAGFAPAKAAQRSLAQSMARGLGPQGIHVAYVIVDGVIDTPRTRSFLRDQPDAFFLAPDAVAASVMHLIQQDRSAWTFELDLRPFGERW